MKKIRDDRDINKLRRIHFHGFGKNKKIKQEMSNDRSKNYY